MRSTAVLRIDRWSGGAGRDSPQQADREESRSGHEVHSLPSGSSKFAHHRRTTEYRGAMSTERRTGEAVDLSDQGQDPGSHRPSQLDTADLSLTRAAAGGVPNASGAAERPGAVIGHYTLIEEIGAGGFGSVFLADQREPVARRVALKIIKLGMDTRQVIARFEQERQALAMMDHPNIARVFDAGTTDTGRPYFVMELVTGEPITTFSDRHQLTVDAAPRVDDAGRQRHPARAPEGHHPPRHQAVERAGRDARRPAARQGHRLRHRQGDRAVAHRRDHPTPTSANWSARRST